MASRSFSRRVKRFASLGPPCGGNTFFTTATATTFFAGADFFFLISGTSESDSLSYCSFRFFFGIAATDGSGVLPTIPPRYGQLTSMFSMASYKLMSSRSSEST